MVVTPYIILSSLIAGILLILAKTRKSTQRKRFMTYERLSIMDKEVRQACTYIENKYQDYDLNLQTISDILVTGPAFLNALFLQELGMSVEEYIDQVRIHRTKQLLQENTHVKVHDAMSLVGYNDPTRFLSVFQAITGLSFEHYLQSHLVVKGA